MKIKTKILALGALLLLTACGSTSDLGSPGATSALQEPTDAQLRAEVQEFLAGTGAPPSSLYDLSRIDLNGDQRRDALVLFKNPYGYWCDTHGCTMLVFRASGSDSFELVNSIQPVRAPVSVSPLKINGWNNIIVHVSGRWTKTKDVAVMFDGQKYQSNPDKLPTYVRYDGEADRRVFY